MRRLPRWTLGSGDSPVGLNGGSPCLQIALRWVGIKKPVLTTGRVMGKSQSTTIIPLGVVPPGHDCFSFQIDSAFQQSAVLMVPTRYGGLDLRCAGARQCLAISSDRLAFDLAQQKGRARQLTPGTRTQVMVALQSPEVIFGWMKRHHCSSRYMLG